MSAKTRLPNPVRPAALRSACLAALGALALSTNALAAETTLERLAPDGDIRLVVDFATVLPLDGRIEAVVIGNPQIADARVTTGSALVLTGKRAGTTNVIALTTGGETLTEKRVVVGARKPGDVLVRKASEVTNFSCTANVCESVAAADVTPEAALPTE